MNHKTKFILTFSVLVIVAIATALFARANYVGLCDPGSDCIYTVDKFSAPVFVFSAVLAPLFFILAFLSSIIFNAWKKFAQIFIPLSILIVIFTPSQCNAPLGMCFDKELAGFWLSAIFFIVSLIIIIHKSIKLKSHKK